MKLSLKTLEFPFLRRRKLILNSQVVPIIAYFSGLTLRLSKSKRTPEYLTRRTSYIQFNFFPSFFDNRSHFKHSYSMEVLRAAWDRRLDSAQTPTGCSILSIAILVPSQVNRMENSHNNRALLDTLSLSARCGMTTLCDTASNRLLFFRSYIPRFQSDSITRFQ